MNYKVNWIENKPTRDGKDKAEVLLVDDRGESVKANIWGNFPNFKDIKVGHTIEAEIVPSKDPKYLPSLRSTALPQEWVNAGTKVAQIKASMEKKEIMIEKAQDNRDQGIKTSSTMRDAVAIAVAEYNNMSDEQREQINLQHSIKGWREWLWKNWDYLPDEAPF